MPTIPINIPSAVLPDLVDAICEEKGYEEMIFDPDADGPEMIPNPESREAFAKRVGILEPLKGYLDRKEIRDAEALARVDAKARAKVKKDQLSI